MDNQEKLKAAQRMQDYIHRYLAGDVALDDICRASMYSKRYAFRIFKEVFDMTPFEYMRALRLTIAARSIRTDSDACILNVALQVGFASHEGFTKAFTSRFGVNPSRYRRHIPRRFCTLNLPRFFIPSYSKTQRSIPACLTPKERLRSP